MPSLWRNVMREVPTKPRQPTSNGKQCTCHCFSTHSVIRGVYLVFLRSFASWVCSSHGTVGSPMMRTLAAPDPMTRSGRRRVMAATAGKTSLSDRSDSTSQLQPPCRILTLFCGLPAFWSVPPPSDTKWMCLSSSLSPDSWFATFAAFSTAFAIARRTWSCLQVYIPCPRALGQALRMCCSAPYPSHMRHLLDLASFHWVRFEGVGRRSYTERRRKEIPCCSIDHRSLHVSFFCSTPSHLCPGLLALPNGLGKALVLFETPQLPATNSLLELPWALDHHTCSWLPRTCRPAWVAPTISLCWRPEIASSTVPAACHFLSDLTSGAMLLSHATSGATWPCWPWTPLWLTSWEAQACLNGRTALPMLGCEELQATSYTCHWSFAPLLQRGATSLMVRGHISLGRRPNCRHQSLHFQGRPLLSIDAKPGDLWRHRTHYGVTVMSTKMSTVTTNIRHWYNIVIALLGPRYCAFLSDHSR